MQTLEILNNMLFLRKFLKFHKISFLLYLVSIFSYFICLNCSLSQQNYMCYHYISEWQTSKGLLVQVKCPEVQNLTKALQLGNWSEILPSTDFLPKDSQLLERKYIMALCSLAIFNYLHFSEIRYMKVVIIYKDRKKLYSSTSRQ